MVNMKFIVFLKGTLGKMVATNTLKKDFINLDFWETWPRKFYNVKAYDLTKDETDDDMDDEDMDDEDMDDEEDVVEDEDDELIPPTQFNTNPRYTKKNHNLF